MIANLGKWEIRSSPKKQAGEERAPEYRLVVISRSVTTSDPDIEETAGDFITRQVLERDSMFFEG